MSDSTRPDGYDILPKRFKDYIRKLEDDVSALRNSRPSAKPTHVRVANRLNYKDAGLFGGVAGRVERRAPSEAEGQRVKPWRLKRTTQCAKCPWRVDVDPHDIPNGYSVDKHRALCSTIAVPGDVASVFAAGHQVMACHETADAHCIGWLMNQVGVGNNLALRLQLMSCENARDIRTVGDQHARFEDTLPGDIDE